MILKRILSFLVFLLLSVAVVLQPLPVFASDIIVDDNSYIDNTDALTLSERIVTMQLFSDALMQGSSDFVISKGSQTSFDDWLDSIITSIHSDLYNDVSGFLEFKQNFNNAVVDVCNTIGDLVETGVDTLEELLGGSTGEYKAHYLPIPHVLNGLRSIAHEEEIPTPQPDPDFSFLVNINNLFLTSGSNKYDFYSFSSAVSKDFGYTSGFNPHNYTWFISENNKSSAHTSGVSNFNLFSLSPRITIYLNESSNGNYVATYTSYSKVTVFGEGFGFYLFDINANKLRWYNNYNSSPSLQTSFNGLSIALNYIYSHFSNVNLYVNGDPWILLDSSAVQPSSIVIGGDTIINNYNYPVRYVFKETEPVDIDYEKLYQVIKRAFNDGSTTTLTTINNGDVFINSNNTTVYPSADIDIPDIDTDLINTFLKYCAIPVFEASMLAPLQEVAVAGNVVAVVSTSWIPSDLLLIFAGFFVLILFIYLIHRLIE